MKKLIVTCTAVAYAIAFIGCGGADPDSMPEGESTADGDDPADLEGDAGEPIGGGDAAGGDAEE